MSRLNEAGAPGGKNERGNAGARRDAAGKGGAGGGEGGIKKNPTIISPAKNATTYVEDGHALGPEG